MIRRLAMFMLIAVGFVLTFLLGSRLASVQGAAKPGEGFAAIPGEIGGQDQTGPYDVVKDWPKPLSALPGHDKWTWGAVQGIFAQNPNRVFVLQRGELPLIPRPKFTMLPQFGPSIAFPVGPFLRNASGASPPGGGGDNTRYDDGGKDIATAEWLENYKMGVDARWEHNLNVVDANGNIVESWTQWDNTFRRPHSVHMNPYDPEKHVWVVDDARHTMFEFTNDGKQLVKTIGTLNVSGADATHFNRPTFLAWLPDGSMYLSDGYAGTRVVKFDKDGKFVKDWGQKGEGAMNKPPDTRPGYFNTPHGIATDPVTRRVFVNDRANRRIQVFDENGKFINQWSQGPDAFVWSIYMGTDQKVWGAEQRTGRLVAWDEQGHLVYAWGTNGSWPGAMWGLHTFSVDQEGNLYLAEVGNGRAQKFVPKKGVNPAFLVGKPWYKAWKD